METHERYNSKFVDSKFIDCRVETQSHVKDRDFEKKFKKRNALCPVVLKLA